MIKANLPVTEQNEKLTLNVEQALVIEAVSPTATVERTDDGALITMTDHSQTTTAYVHDGYSPVAKVETDGDMQTITITDFNGTTSVQVPMGVGYVLTDEDKQEIANLTTIPVKDVQVDSTSIVNENGIANVDLSQYTTKDEVPVESGQQPGSVRTKPIVIQGTTIANSSTGVGSFAEGLQTTASSNSAHSEGNSTTASGGYSHAEGIQSVASGDASHAEGNKTNASGAISHAEGSSTKAAGTGSHAEGAKTEAIGIGSHAEGTCTIAKGNFSHVQGRFNVEDANGTYADIVGNGENVSSPRSNAYALTWTGDGHYAGDVYVHSNADSTGGTKLATLNDIPDAPVQDVQIRGTSVLTEDGIAVIPLADNLQYGVVRGNENVGTRAVTGVISVFAATSDNIKKDANLSIVEQTQRAFRPIVPSLQHESTFYGLAKAAGDTTQSQSTNTVGTYTAEAKAAIQTMLDVPSKADVPTKVSDLTDDSGHYTKPAGGIPASDLAETYLTSYTETDPTVPAWAKEPTKPTYTAAEVGAPTVTEMQQAIANVNTMSVHICTVAEYNAETGVPIIANPDTQTFYLVPGGEGNNLFIEWAYVNNAWERFGSADVDLSNYVQKTDYANQITGGVVKIIDGGGGGFQIDQGYLLVKPAADNSIKSGSISVLTPIIPGNQHASTFYGLAKAAGDSTQSASSNAVGTYTDEAKAAIQQMLDVPSNSDMPVESGSGIGSVKTKDFASNGSIYGQVASGLGAFSEGGNTKATGPMSHAEGLLSQASGASSHAEGFNTNASQSCTHAEGMQTVAASSNQHVQGKYNVSDSNNIYADIIGNGAANARSNAYALTWTGNGHYAGDVYVHCNPDSTGGTKLLTAADLSTYETRIAYLEAEIESLRQALLALLGSETAVTTEDGSQLTDEQGNPIEYNTPTGG